MSAVDRFHLSQALTKGTFTERRLLIVGDRVRQMIQREVVRPPSWLAEKKEGEKLWLNALLNFVESPNPGVAREICRQLDAVPLENVRREIENFARSAREGTLSPAMEKGLRGMVARFEEQSEATRKRGWWEQKSLSSPAPSTEPWKHPIKPSQRARRRSR